MATVILLFIAGLALLLGGADLLVRGASRLALHFGVSPLVVGLTIVAFGTSSPELAVSIQAAMKGESTIAIGNAVGSNIFNVLFILGISALIAPLVVHQQLVRLDVPIMIGVCVTFWLMCLDGVLGRVDAVLLVCGLVLYIVLAIRLSRRESKRVESEYKTVVGPSSPGPPRLWLSLGFIVVGLAICVLGSRWMVNGAVSIAQSFGVSKLVIGLTIVSIGTSLPEVATSIVAAVRGQRDIAVGNVVGSNIFNLLGILGVTGLLSTEALTVPLAALYFDIPVMVAVSLACLPVFFTGHTIERWEGAVFLVFYLAYVIYLVLASQVS